ncbi:MAG TPA: hypothetical protein VFO39_06570 [Candidatus Sulfotelmatobacter sp.]|nr:hypothetical protein [Candidatus Sulfotelmatobacter sp.]
MTAAELSSHTAVLSSPKFNVAVTTESVNHKLPTYAKPEQFARAPFSGFVVVQSIIIGIFEIRCDVHNSNHIADFEIEAKIRELSFSNSSGIGFCRFPSHAILISLGTTKVKSMTRVRAPAPHCSS